MKLRMVVFVFLAFLFSFSIFAQYYGGGNVQPAAAPYRIERGDYAVKLIILNESDVATDRTNKTIRDAPVFPKPLPSVNATINRMDGTSRSVSNIGALIKRCEDGVVNEEMVKKIMMYEKEYLEAIGKNDEKTAREINQKVVELKKEIVKRKEMCLAAKIKENERGEEPGRPGSIVSEVARESGSGEKVSDVARRIGVGYCAELEAWQKKRMVYEDMLASEDKMREADLNKEKVIEILEKLDEGMDKLKEKCELQKEKVAEIGGSEEYEPIKPVAPDSGKEIVSYYKNKIASVITKENSNLDEQIKSLRSLRSEIDKLIEELLERKKKIEASEVGEIVEEIEISPKVLKAGKVEVKAEGKVVEANVSKKSKVEIKPVSDKVLVSDRGVEAEVQKIVLSQNAIKVGEGEVKVSPFEVANKLGISPKKIRIVEDEKKAAYVVDAEKDGKLLGLIPIKVSRTFVVDANTSDILKEEKPWWSALVVEEKK
ncbi:MAG: hypothetical protein QXW70_02385 [Candidatus Anstonellales archaeon]